MKKPSFRFAEIVLKQSRSRWATIGAVLLWLAVSGSQGYAQDDTPIRAGAQNKVSEKAQTQMAAVEQARLARTPAQRKITTQLLLAHQESLTGLAIPGAPKLHSTVTAETDGRYKVRITATVTGELLDAIAAQGGKVLSSFPKYNSIYALMPLANMETLAARPDVQFIGLPPGVRQSGGKHTATATLGQPAAAAPTVNQILGLPSYVDSSVNDPEGDATTGSSAVRAQYGATGAGISVGVLSDSIDNSSDSYEAAVSAGYVPTVNVLSGQAGPSTSTAEGLAMLEIVHRIAPGANLFFAQGGPTEEQMATNIENLQASGCQVIIDDISFFSESPFQDDIVSQAVDAVSAAGVLYFSSASNRGNLDSDASTTWEGNFVQDPNEAGYLNFLNAENNGSVEDLDEALFMEDGTGTFPVSLFWAEPIGGATSQYDLGEYNAEGDLVQVADDDVSSTKTAYQQINGFTAGDYVAVYLASGNAVYLHIDIDADNTLLNTATNGATYGHNACGAANAFCVAATPASTAEGDGGPTGPYPNEFSSSDGVERFSSDGRRHIFFDENGTAITPGNSTSTGGTVLAKPDFTAADGVTTSLPADSGLSPFFGTSAAAPHAGAMAALLLSYYDGKVTPAQVAAAMRAGTVVPSSTSLMFRDYGAGILLAPNIFASAVSSVPPVITSPTTASGTVGTAFAYQITAAGNPTSFGATGLPAGLTVSPSGLISGAPTAAGTYPITISAANASAGTGSAVLTLTVLPAPPVITSAAAVNAQVGVAFAYAITATNSPTSFAAAGLPAGLALNPATGLISGTPAVTGQFPVTLAAANGGGTGGATLTITVLPAAPVITSAASAVGQVGVAFGFAITASNAPTAFSATGLPPGLVLTGGLISGVPAVAGTFPVPVAAGNAGGAGAATLTITIIPAPPVITSAVSVTDEEGEIFSYAITATNGPTAFAASGLPAGLALNPATGVIEGKPTVFGTFQVALAAANAGGTGQAALTLVISKPTVTVRAMVATVKAGSDEAGKFLLILSKAQSKPVVVSYTLEGTAADGTTYKHVKETDTIKVGTTSTAIKIVPKGNFDGSKIVKLVLKDGPDYTVGAVGKAKVKIVGTE